MQCNMNADALSIDDYLVQTGVLFYVSDAVTQLLEHKGEYTQLGVLRYFAEYFNSVKNGNHILFREYSYIKATPQNRASFLRLFWRCFRQIEKNGDLLAVTEYSSLLQLLCPDFPTEMAQNTARIVLFDDVTDSLMSFSDFLYSLQIKLYFEEFLESVSVIYQDLLSGKSPNTVIVPTSSSVERHNSAAEEESETQEAIDATIFFKCIEALCERFRYSHPSLFAVEEILANSQQVSLYGFLMAMAKNDTINEDIGALPKKADFLIDTEVDQELERLIAQIAISPTSNSSGSTTGLREPPKKTSPRKSFHHRKRIEESDGSTEETDSSES